MKLLQKYVVGCMSPLVHRVPIGATWISATSHPDDSDLLIAWAMIDVGNRAQSMALRAFRFGDHIPPNYDFVGSVVADDDTWHCFVHQNYV